MNFFRRLFLGTKPRKLKLKPPYYYPTNLGQAFDVKCSYCLAATTFNTYMRIPLYRYSSG